MGHGGSGGLQVKTKFFWIDSRLSEDGPERSSVEFGMIGNDYLCERFVSAEDDVTAMLPFKFKS